MPFTTGEEDLFQLNEQGFDFNIQFEQLFFSIIPSALFIVTSLWRTLSQSRKPIVVNAPVFQLIKLVGALFDTDIITDANTTPTSGTVCYHHLCRS